ncbi:hypothetical protein UY9_19859, partial [Bacillus atrophaeus C89]
LSGDLTIILSFDVKVNNFFEVFFATQSIQAVDSTEVSQIVHPANLFVFRLSYYTRFETFVHPLEKILFRFPNAHEHFVFCCYAVYQRRLIIYHAYFIWSTLSSDFFKKECYKIFITHFLLI